MSFLQVNYSSLMRLNRRARRNVCCAGDGARLPVCGRLTDHTLTDNGHFSTWRVREAHCFARFELY